MLTSLEEFTLMYMYDLFETSDQENQCLPPEARVVLPALTDFDFTGGNTIRFTAPAWPTQVYFLAANFPEAQECFSFGPNDFP